MTHKIKVCITDDHTLLRKGMVSVIKCFPRVSFVQECESSKVLLKSLRQDASVGVLIISLDLQSGDSFSAIEYILKTYPSLKLLTTGISDNEGIICRTIGMGVHGHLLRSMDVLDIENAIYSVFDKDFYQNDVVANLLRMRIMQGKSQDEIVINDVLSVREIEILRLICKEYCTKEIAEKLSISEKTVHAHRLNIIRKTKARGTIGLLKFAIHHGLFTLSHA